MSQALGATLHFSMPGLDKFTLFAQLPYDIRYKIWENIIYTPGIHFLKFERTEVAEPSSDDSDGGDGEPELSLSSAREDQPEAEKAKKAKFTGQLKPIFPTKAADISYYITQSKTFAQLSSACEEAAHMINLAIQKPHTLTLDNGRLITLAGSMDVICIDYPDMSFTRRLGRWADKLDLEQLAKVRRLAIRYHQEWDGERRVCRYCGHVHDVLRKELPRRHLYEFGALFKNLETFYFIDYLTVRKPLDHLMDKKKAYRKVSWMAPEVRRRMVALAPAHQTKGERFATGGRTYYEVDPDLCKVNTDVFTMLDWVRQSYISHCEKHPEKHSNPTNVKFGVLGCEWEYAEQISKKRKAGRIHFHKRGRPRESLLVDALNDLNLEDQRRCSEFQSPLDLPVDFGDDDEYDFNFEQEPKLPIN
ncbi:uncharacterized protein BCR38DRAFT_443807 [Pseudomassariella vexata]|uniref:Uncharacterized protein n=1 Tax=Pseudomassariella vexata TaxID=1141098 RepID=A0A1Y2DLQ5_9PEZI|nr:uncharacterized protein BCR38DRAFT_443807 [Pseudomassariella vexata]ORY60066.1 hypothetical protein BCR38DRAFT_443807 [Pseudomassariella vexata]